MASQVDGGALIRKLNKLQSFRIWLASQAPAEWESWFAPPGPAGPPPEYKGPSLDARTPRVEAAMRYRSYAETDLPKVGEEVFEPTAVGAPSLGIFNGEDLAWIERYDTAFARHRKERELWRRRGDQRNSIAWRFAWADAMIEGCEPDIDRMVSEHIAQREREGDQIAAQAEQSAEDSYANQGGAA